MNDIHKIGTQLLLKEPFFGHLLLQVNKKLSHQVESIELKIGASFQLTINPGYWQSLQTTQQQIGAIKHQLLHLIFQHPFLHHSFSNSRLQSIALDLVVNQYLTPAQLSTDAINFQTFKDINWSDDASLKTYYQTLLRIFENPNSLSIYTLQHLLSQPNIVLNQHQNWFNMTSPATQQIAQQQVKQLVKSSLTKMKKQGGKLAGNLEARLQQQYTHPPTINWKKALRIFTFNNTRTTLKSTIRRPSKRYGTTPGIKIQSRPKLLIALDTSSSMQLKTIEVFYTEILQLRKQGCAIQMIEFDTIIQQSYHFEGKSFKPIKGRGGTNLNAPLSFANQQQRIDSVLIFTDGAAKTPTVKCRYPLLWIISPNGIATQTNKWRNLPQRKIKMS